MEENRRGFHHPNDQGHDHNTGAQGRMEPNSGRHQHMSEPTNHGGPTHEMARTREHAANIEHMRNMHAGKGQQDHEKILHETHKLHQGEPYMSHGNKHGAAHHWREEAGEGHSRDPAKFMREEAAERRRGEE
jgi:hypothetical protein